MLPLLAFLPIALPGAAQRLAPEFAAALAHARAEERVAAVLVMQARPPLDELLAAGERLAKPARRALVEERLRALAEASQAPVAALLASRAAEVERDEPLWIANARLVRASPRVLLELAQLPGVERVLADPELAPELLRDAPPPACYSIATLPYATSFESGVLPPEFETSLLGAAAVQVTSAHGPSDGAFHMTLGGTSALSGKAIATLHADLAGVVNPVLSFDLKSFDTAQDFSDGLFLSIDGSGLLPILPFPPAGPYQSYSLSLDLAAGQLGVALSSNTRIAFSWQGNAAVPNQGFAIDKIALAAAPPPAGSAEPNLQALQAPALWAMGIDGSGVSLLTVDLGTQRAHPALAPHIWSNPGEIAGNGLDDDANGKIDDSWGWDFVGNDANPLPSGDEHGTMTAGILCGSGQGNGGVPTGMAPGLKLGVARASSQGQMIAAYQYGLAEGFDALSSSLSLKWPTQPDYHLFRQTCDALLAAGLIQANSIGNQGTDLFNYPIPYNIATPGNCPGPWRHPSEPAGGRSAILACGAILQGSDALDPGSGRGPAAWENIQLTAPGYPWPQNPVYWDYPYFGGGGPGLLKPDLVAYTYVKTTVGSAGYYGSFGGTSAATPQLGGALALLIDANPRVPPRQIAQALQQTALDLGAPGKDALFGAGKLQARDAALRVLAAVTAYPSEPALGSSGTLELSGPAGDAYILALGFAAVSIPTQIGVTIEVGQPLVVLANGLLQGYANPLALPFAIPADPLLAGLTLRLQLFTDDTQGPSGQWLDSLVEKVVVQ